MVGSIPPTGGSGSAHFGGHAGDPKADVTAAQADFLAALTAWNSSSKSTSDMAAMVKAANTLNTALTKALSGYPQGKVTGEQQVISSLVADMNRSFANVGQITTDSNGIKGNLTALLNDMSNSSGKRLY